MCTEFGVWARYAEIKIVESEWNCVYWFIRWTCRWLSRLFSIVSHHFREVMKRFRPLFRTPFNKWPDIFYHFTASSVRLETIFLSPSFSPSRSIALHRSKARMLLYKYFRCVCGSDCHARSPLATHTPSNDTFHFIATYICQFWTKRRKSRKKENRNQ